MHNLRVFGLSLTMLLVIFSCKSRQGVGSAVKEADPVQTALAKLDAFYLELGRFKKEVDEYFVPQVADDFRILNPDKIVKMSRIVEIENEFDEVLNALSRANFNLNDSLKNNLLDQQNLLITTAFPAAKYNMPNFKATGISSVFNGIRGLMAFGERAANWELFNFCGEVYKGRKFSRQWIINLLSTSTDGVFHDGIYVDAEVAGNYFMDPNRRTVLWNLAGRPRIRGEVHSKDIWTVDPNSGKTITADTGQIRSLATNTCEDYVAPATPKELEESPQAVRERIVERVEFNDCPEPFKYKSWVGLSWGQIVGEFENFQTDIERVENMDNIVRWIATHCKQVAKSIDEMNIEKPDSFPLIFLGLVSHKYKPGYTRELSEKAFKDKLNERIEIIGLVRNSLAGSATDSQRN